MSQRPFNFSAGPAIMPAPVLEQAAAEMLDWRGSGMSVMEMSHRGKEFMSIIERAEADLRELMSIPDNYRVLFLQGGATLQFSQIPLNLLNGKSADYLITGQWSKKAYKEAQRFGQVRIAANSDESDYTRYFQAEELKLDPNAAYVHICTNETIGGVEVFDDLLPRGDVPVIADMSSNILSRPVDVSQYGLIYAGAQKNVGPAGLTLVIVREDLLGKAGQHIPTLMDYQVLAENDSMLNTPPTYSIYLAGLVFAWLKEQGGVAAIERRNIEKADLLYHAIDHSGGFYRNPVEKPYRSRMNVPFTLNDSALDAEFLAEAKAAGLLTLKGHKSVGGMRASIYNAMPVAGVEALVEFMQHFAAARG